ncbi:MAG: hypothetical protein N2511_03275, partial [Thermodesulfovibrionales bacterium]|nr:hypothetical protein [Thermodesulfovibrionales bacterium]
MEFQQHKLLEYISSIDSNPPFTQAEISYLELTAHFQPIFHARDGSVFGYEALARHISKNINIKKLFYKAKEEGSAVLLDMICRQIAMERASIQGIDCYLFSNSCAETLM